MLSSEVATGVTKSDMQSLCIPDGFVMVLGPANERYIIPDFFKPALYQLLDSFREKQDLEIEKEEGTVSVFLFLYFSFGQSFSFG